MICFQLVLDCTRLLVVLPYSCDYHLFEVMDLMGNSFNAVSCLEAFAVAMCVARLDVAQSSPREDQAGQFEDQADQVKGATRKRAHSGSRASRGRGRGRGGAAGKRARGKGRGEAVAENGTGRGKAAGSGPRRTRRGIGMVAAKRSAKQAVSSASSSSSSSSTSSPSCLSESAI